MYIVTVDFDLDPRYVAPFMDAMLENARESRAVEAGCRQFDVCRSEDDPTKVFLYEVYDDRAAFESHVASEHYKAFAAKVGEWVTGKRVNYYRNAPATG